MRVLRLPSMMKARTGVKIAQLVAATAMDLGWRTVMMVLTVMMVMSMTVLSTPSSTLSQMFARTARLAVINVMKTKGALFVTTAIT